MKIKELLSDEGKWTKGRNARDAMNYPVPFFDERATCWCLNGAVYKCYSGEDAERVWTLLNEAVENFENFVGFNDAPETNFEDIKRLVEKLDI